jgi:LAGLIDADG endonuclease
LSGFIDAEGCFSVNIYEGRNKNKFCRCRYILDQKDTRELLLYIKDIFNYGSVNLRNKMNNVYRLTVSMKNPKRKDFSEVINYFNNFPLKTTKSFNFQL